MTVEIDWTQAPEGYDYWLEMTPSVGKPSHSGFRKLLLYYPDTGARGTCYVDQGGFYWPIGYESSHFTVYKRPEQPKQESNVMTKKTVKYEFVKELLDKLNEYARGYDSREYGLPVYFHDHNQRMIEIVVKHFNLELDESPKIAKIVEMTGCSRWQALKLLEELE